MKKPGHSTNTGKASVPGQRLTGKDRDRFRFVTGLVSQFCFLLFFLNVSFASFMSQISVTAHLCD